MPGGSVSRLVVRAESRLCHTNEYLCAMEYACSSPADIDMCLRMRVSAFFYADYFMPIILCEWSFRYKFYDIKILYELFL